MQKIRLAIFASGSGTNARAIMERFSKHALIQTSVIVTNNPDAGVIKIAGAFFVPCEIISREQTKDGKYIVGLLKKYVTDFIALAGYLKLIPVELIRQFPKRIINIHPSLLPDYGGKGMYGLRVHESVISNREKESGLTIHYVDEEYDHGKIIFRKRIPVDPSWDAHKLAEEILALEHINYPEVLERLMLEYSEQAGKPVL